MDLAHKNTMHSWKIDQELLMILFVYVMCVSCSFNAVRRNSCCCAGTVKAQPWDSFFCVNVVQAIFVVCAMHHRRLRRRWCFCASTATHAATYAGLLDREAFSLKAGWRQNVRGPSAARLSTFATTRYIGRCLNNTALPVLNATFIPSSKFMTASMTKRRQQGVSLVLWYFVINSFLRFKIRQVTNLQIVQIWRCHAFFSWFVKLFVFENSSTGAAQRYRFQNWTKRVADNSILHILYSLFI